MVLSEVDLFMNLAERLSVARERTIAAVDRTREKIDSFLERIADRFDRHLSAGAPTLPFPLFRMADLIPEKTQWERLASNLTRSIAGAAIVKSHQELAAIKLDAAVYELDGLVAELSSVMRVVRNVAGAPVVGRIEPATGTPSAHLRRDRSLAA